MATQPTKELKNIMTSAETLYDRWQDEKEFEDFNDYIKTMTATVKVNKGKLIKMTNKPFKLTVELQGAQHDITVTANATKLTTKELPATEKKVAEKPAAKKTPAKPAAPAKKTEKKEPTAAKPKVGSGARIRELLTEGKLTPAEIVAVIHKEFPSSKATVKDVYWQRNYLKNNK